eukprot:scaffold16_cov242-Pinguiococcus_pyrenoidosus.AAC.8
MEGHPDHFHAVRRKLVLLLQMRAGTKLARDLPQPRRLVRRAAQKEILVGAGIEPLEGKRQKTIQDKAVEHTVWTMEMATVRRPRRARRLPHACDPLAMSLALRQNGVFQCIIHVEQFVHAAGRQPPRDIEVHVESGHSRLGARMHGDALGARPSRDGLRDVALLGRLPLLASRPELLKLLLEPLGQRLVNPLHGTAVGVRRRLGLAGHLHRRRCRRVLLRRQQRPQFISKGRNSCSEATPSLYSPGRTLTAPEPAARSLGTRRRAGTKPR